MKIEKLEIENFRQFYGKQVIEFGQGENNVTIILGANGNGKTGIFRAIMFALYGDMSLEQENKIKETPILVNIKK
ncbi:MAG: AAA family ATPase [Atopostipes sp.]|nr:AAA family ATPase [Atopostipes sp.]